MKIKTSHDTTGFAPPNQRGDKWQTTVRKNEPQVSGSIEDSLAAYHFSHAKDARSENDGRHAITDTKTGAFVARMDALEAAAFVRTLQDGRVWRGYRPR